MKKKRKENSKKNQKATTNNPRQTAVIHFGKEPKQLFVFFTDARLTGDQAVVVRSPLGQQHSFEEIDHEVYSTLQSFAPFG